MKEDEHEDDLRKIKRDIEFFENRDTACLHKQCDRCNGTGVDKLTKQFCIHMISCPCRLCNPSRY